MQSPCERTSCFVEYFRLVAISISQTGRSSGMCTPMLPLVELLAVVYQNISIFILLVRGDLQM